VIVFTNVLWLHCVGAKSSRTENVVLRVSEGEKIKDINKKKLVSSGQSEEVQVFY
jgi:hypothetical protein